MDCKWATCILENFSAMEVFYILIIWINFDLLESLLDSPVVDSLSQNYEKLAIREAALFLV